MSHFFPAAWDLERWACYFLTERDVSCDHVAGFSMDEWSDKKGQTAGRLWIQRLTQ